MTGYTVHTGSNDKFSSGWDRAFGGKPATGKKAAAKKAARRPASPPEKKEEIEETANPGPIRIVAGNFPARSGGRELGTVRLHNSRLDFRTARSERSPRFKEAAVSEQDFADDLDSQDEELELYGEDAEVEESTEDEFEEISSEEVDRVVAALDDLLDTVESENIKAFLEDAMNSIYFLVYDVEEEGDAATDAA